MNIYACYSIIDEFLPILLMNSKRLLIKNIIIISNTYELAIPPIIMPFCKIRNANPNIHPKNIDNKKWPIYPKS